MWLYCLKSVRDTVDISETRRSPVEVGSLSTTIYKVLPNHPTPVVGCLFFSTSNSIASRVPWTNPRWWREHPATLERPVGARDVVLKKASINAFRDLDIRRSDDEFQ